MPAKKKTEEKTTKSRVKKVSTPLPIREKNIPIGKIIGITFVVTAIVAVSLMYSWHAKEMKKVEILNSKSCVEVAQLYAKDEDKILKLNEDITNLEKEKQDLVVLYTVVEQPKEGWEKYIPTQPEDETAEPVVSELISKTTEETRELLGEAPVVLRDYPTSEIWVYHTSDEEPSGLYVIFNNEKVVDVYIDELNGVDNLSDLIKL